MTDIESKIRATAIMIQFGDETLDDINDIDPFIRTAARVLLQDWKPLTLPNSNNDQANYATGLIVHRPAKRLY